MTNDELRVPGALADLEPLGTAQRGQTKQARPPTGRKSAMIQNPSWSVRHMDFQPFPLIG
jgi:hypothetical protein